MKKHFFEYYDSVSDEERKKIFSDCIFVFDTNVILNLYRYTQTTRDKMLSIMEKYQDRIWMPYQVGWEFFNNREDVIKSVRDGCEDIENTLKSYKNDFSKKLDNHYKRHPYIDKEYLKTKFDEVLVPVREILEGLKTKDPNYLDRDVIWEKLTMLFENRIGDDYDNETLNKLYEEGEVRYMHSIPPGYVDLKEKKNLSPRHLYGDLIVWKQTIQKAKSAGKDIVFVSDDQKEDWYEKTERNAPKRPRRELVKEFGLETKGKYILLYNQDGFLHYINEYFGADVEDTVITEINEVSDQESKKQEAIQKINQDFISRINSLYPQLAQIRNLSGSIAIPSHSFPVESFADIYKAQIASWEQLYKRSGSFMDEIPFMQDSLRSFMEKMQSAGTIDMIESIENKGIYPLFKMDGISIVKKGESSDAESDDLPNTDSKD